jgi:hypothetical protein
MGGADFHRRASKEQDRAGKGLGAVSEAAEDRFRGSVGEPGVEEKQAFVAQPSQRPQSVALAGGQDHFVPGFVQHMQEDLAETAVVLCHEYGSGHLGLACWKPAALDVGAASWSVSR